MTPEEEAAHNAEVEKQVRDLATQIAAMTKLGFDPMTIRKCIISAIDDTASPPTVSLNLSGDTDTLVTAVRTLNNYTPIVNQTALLAKQGTEIFLLGAIAATTPAGTLTQSDNGWIKATLTAGSHNGNSNGDVYYRRVMDHGAWKMQWRGAWINSGTKLVTALDPDYRPTSKRSVLCARETATGAVAAQFDFQTSGDVDLVGKNITSLSTSGQQSSSASPQTGDPFNDPLALSGNVYNNPGGSGSHDHTIGHWHTVDGHTHGNGAHTHPVNDPTWISLNGVEYFL